MERLPDRHLECSSCKKSISYVHTEVIDKSICSASMCSECPFLKKKIPEYPHVPQPESAIEESKIVCCGSCGLTEDEVRMGGQLGCSLCYEVFEDILVKELAQVNHIVLKSTSKRPTLHIGRHPEQAGEVNPASKLLALHQALHDTLGREDYEQAAKLRDQIKALSKEKSSKTSKATKQAKPRDIKDT